jgi:hypothetical protein
MRAIERRREPRVPTEALIQLLPAGTNVVVNARLLDRSEHGFRAAHGCLALTTALEVCFRDGEREGKARVMWNCVVGENKLQSGFMILSTYPAGEGETLSW